MQIRGQWTANDVRDLLNEMEHGYKDLGVLVVNPFEVIEGARWLLSRVEEVKPVSARGNNGQTKTTRSV
jgi:hypothetical protein